MSQKRLLDLASGLDRSVSGVHILLLLSIILYGRAQKRDSLIMLDRAVELSIDLRLFDWTALSALANGDVVLEESYVRTWWELSHVVTILSVFSASTASEKIRLCHCDLPLPCEERAYNRAGLPLTRRTQSQFLDRTIFNDPYTFSSIAYRIEAARLLGEAQQMGTRPTSVDRQRILINSLLNFNLSLPQEKRDPIQADGLVDEVLVQALTIASIAMILATQPRSTIIEPVKSSEDVICKPYKDHCNGDYIPETQQDRPSTRSLRAADTIADRASTQNLTCTVVCHTPFYACTTALACAVHVGEYQSAASGVHRDLIKERIKLSLNALSRIGEKWPLARDISQRVASDVRNVMAGERSTISNISVMLSAQRNDLGTDSTLLS